MLQTKVVEEFKTRILCSLPFCFENRAVYEIMGENTAERSGTQTTTTHAYCMLDT